MHALHALREPGLGHLRLQVLVHPRAGLGHVVLEQEREEWLAQQAEDQTADIDQAGSSVPDSQESLTPAVADTEETTTEEAEPDVVGEELGEEASPVLIGQPEAEGLWLSLIQDEDVEKT